MRRGCAGAIPPVLPAEAGSQSQQPPPSGTSLQRDESVHEIHDRRDNEAHRQIRDYDEPEGLELVTGLVDHRGGDIDVLRVADRERQARVLPQIQVLVVDGRNGYAHRLGKDHKPELLAGFESQRLGRLFLTLRDGENASAHYLSDEGGGVDHESGENSGELGTHLQSTGVAVLTHLRRLDGEGTEKR